MSHAVADTDAPPAAPDGPPPGDATPPPPDRPDATPEETAPAPTDGTVTTPPAHSPRRIRRDAARRARARNAAEAALRREAKKKARDTKRAARAAAKKDRRREAAETLAAAGRDPRLDAVATTVAVITFASAFSASFYYSFVALMHLAETEAKLGNSSIGLPLMIDMLTIGGYAMVRLAGVNTSARRAGFALFLTADSFSLAGQAIDAFLVRKLSVVGGVIHCLPPFILAITILAAEYVIRHRRLDRIAATLALAEAAERRDKEARALAAQERRDDTIVAAEAAAIRRSATPPRPGRTTRRVATSPRDTTTPPPSYDPDPDRDNGDDGAGDATPSSTVATGRRGATPEWVVDAARLHPTLGMGDALERVGVANDAANRKRVERYMNKAREGAPR